MMPERLPVRVAARRARSRARAGPRARCARRRLDRRASRLPAEAPEQAVEVAPVDVAPSRARARRRRTPEPKTLTTFSCVHRRVERRLALEHRAALRVGHEVRQEALDDEPLRLGASGRSGWREVDLGRAADGEPRVEPVRTELDGPPVSGRGTPRPAGFRRTTSPCRVYLCGARQTHKTWTPRSLASIAHSPRSRSCGSPRLGGGTGRVQGCRSTRVPERRGAGQGRADPGAAHAAALPRDRRRGRARAVRLHARTSSEGSTTSARG